MKILISGATGNVGSELAKALVRKGVPFRAMVRGDEGSCSLRSLPGVEVVSGDFDDSESMARALRGVERAFLLSPSTERAEARQLAFVEAAKRSGVLHVVKLSQWAADAASPVRFLRYHAAVEAALRASGMAFTVLRPNLFMQGLLGFRRSIASEGRFFAAAGDARISLIDVRDIAALAAEVLTGAGHEGKIYQLTGPEAMTHAEIAAQLSTALGRAITFVDVPSEAMRGALAGAGIPPWQVDGLIEDYAHYRRDEAREVTATVQAVTGHPSRAFSTFAADYAAAFA
ncbi:SDR family oxidoreductase [Vulgatibacter incomptus]|uniref:NmrA-like domain-containing protein n=1 Tax=Vulgatibacter incomptus TaxID=1391653 RepID=A0A0K1PG20_9BACT|nr:SDR family oxidoreductase [Vulgatibacter incomptus]AKU92465.1 hypothetical protein AKJ08_2852 [Vulgatibacter incomptus]